MDGELFPDLDPLSPEGQEDINDVINDEYDSLIPKDDESGQSFYSRMKQKFGDRYKYAINRVNDLFKSRNKGQNIPVYMELENMEDLKEKEANIAEAEQLIKNQYPEWDPHKSTFLFNLDEYGRVEIRLHAKSSKIYYLGGLKNAPKTITDNLGAPIDDIKEHKMIKTQIDGLFPENTINDDFNLRYGNDNRIEINVKGKDSWHSIYKKDGTLNKNMPNVARIALGKEADTIITENESKVKKNSDKISTLKERIEDINEDDTQDVIRAKEKLNETIEEQIQELEQEQERLREQNEVIEERLPLRERIKQIIKRYGLTVTGIALCVGTIIGVILNSLKSGLSTIANGLGSGLKSLGKKLGQILPGMVGAIASFIFKTAGQVVSFLANNAWLLIVAAVTYIIERYKKKK